MSGGNLPNMGRFGEGQLPAAEADTVLVHAVNACADCQWHRAIPDPSGGDKPEIWNYCVRPGTLKIQSIVTGAMEERPLGPRRCESERAAGDAFPDMCGVDGRFFTPKEP
jgi:hypothetical protein